MLDKEDKERMQLLIDLMKSSKNTVDIFKLKQCCVSLN
jgi:hypothetical protein